MGFDTKKITTLVLCFLFGVAIAAALLLIRKCGKKPSNQPKSTKSAEPVQCTKSKLGTATVVTNVLLSLLFVPLSLMGIFGAMLADNPPDHFLARGVLYAAVMLSVYMPAFCIASIALSVILRKKGKHLFGFLVQFAPILIFALVFVLLLISNIIAASVV